MTAFIKELWNEKKIIWELAKNDCRARFASSGLGIVWAFLQPLMTILVFWFVFQIGFKTAPIADAPFMVWYIPAFLSWTYFSEGLMQVTNSLLEYRYLVKKVNFKISVIPLIKVISSGFIHVAFLGFIVLINFLYGRMPSLYYLQSIYYFLCMAFLLMGLGWLLSSVAVFITDVANIVTVVIQIGFWATPIFWDPSSMTPVIQNILKINPMYYICVGYRDTFVNQVWFWEKPWDAAYFWVFSICIFLYGTHTFHKLSPHFDDVL